MKKMFIRVMDLMKLTNWQKNIMLNKNCFSGAIYLGNIYNEINAYGEKILIKYIGNIE